MSLTWGNDTYSGEMVDGILSSVDRAFAKAGYKTFFKPKAEQCAALHETEGQRQSAPADGSKPLGLAGIFSKSQGGNDGCSNGHAHQVGQQSQRQDNRLSGNSRGEMRVSGFDPHDSDTELIERGQAHRRVDCGVPAGIDGLTRIASGQQQAKADAALRPATGIASGQADSGNGRATAGTTEGAHGAAITECAPSVFCPDCKEKPESGRIYECQACGYRGCGSCYNAHLDEPHWTDGAASSERQNGLRIVSSSEVQR